MESLRKKVKVFSGKVKTASNIATFLFLSLAAYTINQWQRVSGFDSFINILMAAMILIVNIKLYKINLELRNTEELTDEPGIKELYRLQKKEYKEWVIVSLLMLASIIILKMLL